MWVLDTELKLSGVTLPVEFLHWLSSYILREPTWRNANAILSYYFSKISAAEECYLDGRRVCTRARRNYRDPGEKQKTPQLSLGGLNGQREQANKKDGEREGLGRRRQRPAVVNSVEREAEETG